MPTVIDQAVCIRQWDWSETSQTVSVFARGHGIIRGVAKGSKREGSKFSGGLEVLTRGEVVANVKAAEGLALLTAWDLQETFPAARATLSAFYAGMCMLDLVHHAVRDSDPHEGLFDGLVACLRRLGEAREDRAATLAFLWGVLDETGHRPELDRDVRGGGVLAEAASYGFVPRLGGVTVDDRRGDGADGPVLRVRAETVALLRAVAAASDGDVAAGELEAEAADAAVGRALRLLAVYFREVFAADPPSLRAFAGG